MEPIKFYYMKEEYYYKDIPLFTVSDDFKTKYNDNERQKFYLKIKIYDLKKFHAETYELFKQHRENTMFEKISDNLKLGIEQNLFRSDLNIPLTTGFYMGLIDLCLSDEIQSLSKSCKLYLKYRFSI